MQYVAVKVDMVHSRRLSQRAQVQERFLDCAYKINQRFADSLEASFVVTHGDEAQCLLRASKALEVFALYESLVQTMRPTQFRCGVGLGPISTALQRDAIGMDGLAWQNAKAAIDQAKRSRQYMVFHGFGPADQALDGLGNLLCHLQSRWSPEQWEVIEMVDRGLSQGEIAQQLGVSRVAVSKRLTAAGWKHYHNGRDALRYLLEKVE